MVSLSSSLVAQDLSKHNWQNRLIVILTNDEQNEIYKNQVAAFKHEKEGFDERKLVVYHATPNEYKTGFDNPNWKKSILLYERFKKSYSDFEVLLLGLDGGVKLRQNSLLTVQKLYSTIDVMPMRRQEINSKN